jgi:hypothetical protein
MTGTSNEDMVGDDLLVSSLITNSPGMAEAGALYMSQCGQGKRG